MPKGDDFSMNELEDVSRMIGKTVESVDSSSEYRLIIHFTDKTHVTIGIFCGDHGSPSYFFEDD